MVLYRILLILITVLLSIVMTGCFKGEIRIDINKNGSADLDYHITAAPMLTDKINEMKQDLSKQGFAIVDLQEGNWIGIQAKKHLANSEELRRLNFFQNGRGQHFSQATQKSDELTIERGWFQDVYVFNVNFDPFQADSGTVPPDKMAQAILSQVQMKLIINFPIKPDSHNASRVQDDGKLLEWNLIVGQNNVIQAKAKVWNWGHIGITVAIMIVLVGVSIWAYKRRTDLVAENREDNLTHSRKLLIAGSLSTVIFAGIAGGYYYYSIKPETSSTAVSTAPINSNSLESKGNKTELDTNSQQTTAKTNEAKSKEPQASKQVKELQKEDFSLAGLNLVNKSSDIEKILGKPVSSSYFTNNNAKFQQAKYDGVTVTSLASPNPQNNTIWEIRITTDKFETTRGIKPGQSVEDLIAAYGKPKRISTFYHKTLNQECTLYTYMMNKNPIELNFVIDKESYKIIEIDVDSWAF